MKSDYVIVLHVMTFRLLNWSVITIGAFMVRIFIVFVVDLNDLSCVDVNWFLRAPIFVILRVVVNDVLKHLTDNRLFSRIVGILVFV